jgi:sulfite reductase (ferredoxin)
LFSKRRKSYIIYRYTSSPVGLRGYFLQKGMNSFRTELEDPIVQKDIIDLEKKIREFREGKIGDERFRSLRLARGIYGQRQPGVQMIRIKLPFGKVSFKQFLRIADISDEYAGGNLHLTTRQDIQIHYVSLDRTPELWSKLEQDDITLREACGNTVRNVTASPSAGIDPNEPFDVSPYAYATFSYFLRNPICQEMGRKFKIAFSSSDADTAFSYIHDLGFIPKLQIQNGEEIRGFKVLFGGGLGAQPSIAHAINEFLPEDELIPFIESTLRVFDRHGERSNRNKARLKFLVAKFGLDEVLRLINEETIANRSKKFIIDRNQVDLPQIPEQINLPECSISDQFLYQRWLDTNVFEQKQSGFYGVYIKVTTGDIPTSKARAFIAAIQGLVADEIRITINQGLLLKYVRQEALPHLFERLKTFDFVKPGFDSVSDITTCPGTDTCNLGISNSTELARVLEKQIAEEYDELIENQDIKIKISGCMNSCGQHGLAHIGFHGSSLKAAGKVVPAAQVLLGGGTVGNGLGRAADKIIKVPSKRSKEVIKLVLDDYSAKKLDNERFNDFYDRFGKDYFYQLLKPLADLSTLTPYEFIDWGHEGSFETAIGVGECAGVIIDLVSTLLLEAEEKLQWAIASIAGKAYSDSIYHAYSVYISSAKALLLDKGINSSTHIGIIRDFDEQFKDSSLLNGFESFGDQVLEINKNEPSAEFARTYLNATVDFLKSIKSERESN